MWFGRLDQTSFPGVPPQGLAKGQARLPSFWNLALGIREAVEAPNEKVDVQRSWLDEWASVYSSEGNSDRGNPEERTSTTTINIT